MRVSACNMSNSSLIRMPIWSQNELLHMFFPIGSDNDGAELLVLFDTGGAFNTGNFN